MPVSWLTNTRQAVHADDGLLLALVDLVPHHLQHLVSDEVFARAVGVDDGLDQVLGHVPVVRQQLFGVFGQAVADIAEARVVVVGASARPQTHAVDNVACVETTHFAVHVELVEAGRMRRQISVERLAKPTITQYQIGQFRIQCSHQPSSKSSEVCFQF